MGSFGITILITILIGLWSSKSLKKVLPADMDAENDADIMPDETFAEEDCFMDESESESEPVVRVQEVVKEQAPVAVCEEAEEEPAFDLRQAVIYQTILQNEHLGIK